MANLDTLEYGKIRELVRGFAASALGRSVAGEMIPYWDADRANRALAETDELRALLMEDQAPSTAGFRDVRPHLDHLREFGRPLEPDELIEVKELLEAGHRLRERFAKEDPGRSPRLRAMTAPIGNDSDLVEAIETKLDRKLGVKDEASAALAKVRARLRTLDTYLRNKAEELARSDRYRPHLTQLRPLLRGGHYLLQVKADSMRRVDGILHDRSNTGVTAFIEPRELVPYGNERKDVKVRESREVQRVLWEISRDVIRREEGILATLRRVAWFDFTLAKARMAIAFDMNSPRVGGKVLTLRKALHPLLMLKTGSHATVPHIALIAPQDRFDVVPLSLRVGEDFDLLVITGPNTGGKTVALKTVGLLTLMALSGVPIPAAPESAIPAYKDVLADIGDEQSIEQSLSTFSAHMRRITTIMREAGPEVLVLLDELGSGTDPNEGEALGRAILTRLLGRGVPGVVTTHLGALKTLAYEFRRAENACMEFDPKSLAPTFTLRLGLPGNSNALIIAARLGMERRVVEAAERALEQKDRRAEKVIADLQATRVDAERRRAASEEMLAEASRRQADVEAEAEQVRARQDELKTFADREVERHLRRVRDRLFPLLNRLKNVPKPFDDEVQALVEALDDSLRVTPLGEKREAFIARLKKDHRIEVPRLGVRGRVVRIDKKRRLIGIVVGDLRMDVPFEDVLPEEG